MTLGYGVVTRVPPPCGYTVTRALYAYRSRLVTYGFTWHPGDVWTRGPLDFDEDAGAFEAFLTELRTAGCVVAER